MKKLIKVLSLLGIFAGDEVVFGGKQNQENILKVWSRKGIK